tara:strand:+ start:634 stop:1029 length:396 start_codon:yes stop_codon:yes gene_type:complete
MKFNNLLLFLFLFSFAGCATYNKNPVTTYESDEDASVTRIAGGDNKTKNIVILNSFKNQANGNLFAKVEVQNQSSKPSIFLYKFDWIAEDGSVENSPIWNNATINGKEIQTLNAIDPRGNATDFRLLLKGI